MDDIIVHTNYFAEMPHVHSLWAVFTITIIGFVISVLVFSVSIGEVKKKTSVVLGIVSLAIICTTIFIGVAANNLGEFEVAKTISQLEEQGFSKIDLATDEVVAVLDGTLTRCSPLELSKDTFQLLCTDD